MSDGAASVIIRPADFERIDTGRTRPNPCQEDLVDRARQEADVIVRTARAEAEAILAQAYAEGYSSGVRDGVKTVDDLIARLESDLSELASERARLVEELEPEVLKLCQEAVEKIVRHEIRTDPRVVMRAIKTCLKRIKDPGDASVRVSPSEVEHVRANRDELLSATEMVRSVNIISDRRISPGGCTVEAESGTFDARVETQLNRLNKKITETYENRAPETQSGTQ